ncbi:hypothetical protein PSHT_10641 [Puccinia striiformis]|uniref:Uncharacterized protein n=1 Tax=Puccinia striiformis TaxID=27350 RepID=A0A2S4V8I3_9BASI|nr:hypothetical protein PSHT_10641 [Puccinia striiformis]
MNARRIDSYRHHIKEYLNSCQILFPHVDLAPNHHLSMHLADCLETVWSGQLEITFMREFCRAGNLRGLLNKSDFFPDTLKSAVTELKDLYEPIPFTSKYQINKSDNLSTQDTRKLVDYLNTGSTGTHWAMTSDWTRLSPSEKKKISPLASQKQSHQHFEHRGVTFSTWTSNCKNSIISVHESFSILCCFAQIVDIFTHIRINNMRNELLILG